MLRLVVHLCAHSGTSVAATTWSSRAVTCEVEGGPEDAAGWHLDSRRSERACARNGRDSKRCAAEHKCCKARQEGQSPGNDACRIRWGTPDNRHLSRPESPDSSAASSAKLTARQGRPIAVGRSQAHEATFLLVPTYYITLESLAHDASTSPDSSALRPGASDRLKAVAKHLDRIADYSMLTLNPCSGSSVEVRGEPNNQ